MNKSKTAAVVASLAMCALTGAQAQAPDVGSGKGFLESGWSYVQYLFADRAASAAMNDANKAAPGRSNSLGLGASRELQFQAEAQMQQRDFLAADKTLRRALSLAPELASTQAMLAVAIDGQGRRPEALAMLEALTNNAAQSASASARSDAMTSVAAAHNSIGDPKRALQIYNQLIADNVDSAAVHAGRGEALQRLDDDVAALASFQLASEVEPRFPGLELKRAQSLEKLGRSSEAENAYRVALQLDPNSVAARASVARLEGRRPAAVSEVAATPGAVAPALVVAATEVAVAAPAKEDAPKKSAKQTAAEKVAALNAVAEKMVATAPAPLPPTPTPTPTPTPPPTPAPTAAQAPSPDKVPSADAQAAVLAQLGKWQAAWAGKEVDTYLGFYAKSFTPSKLNRAAWQADRLVKLSKPGPIQVNIVEPSFELERGVLKVTFTQEYTSSNFRDRSRKRIDWVQEGAEWRIQREVTL
jgi:tetratricopeptide (TPR) repeat protein